MFSNRSGGTWEGGLLTPDEEKEGADEGAAIKV